MNDEKNDDDEPPQTIYIIYGKNIDFFFKYRHAFECIQFNKNAMKTVQN